MVILFCTKFTDFSDNIDRYKNFFGPLGYSASAYVMVGPERYSLQTADAFPVVCCSQATKGINPLDLGPGFFSENTLSERPCIAAAQLPFRINSKALPILVYLLYGSSKPLHTEKAGSKGTGTASKVARQE